MSPAHDAAAHSGSKYLRTITGRDAAGNVVRVTVDVYDVLEAFEDPPAPVAHAIKKLLCAGLRGKGDRTKDLRDARDAVSRAITMAEQSTASDKT